MSMNEGVLKQWIAVTMASRKVAEEMGLDVDLSGGIIIIMKEKPKPNSTVNPADDWEDSWDDKTILLMAIDGTIVDTEVKNRHGLFAETARRLEKAIEEARESEEVRKRAKEIDTIMYEGE